MALYGFTSMYLPSLLFRSVVYSKRGSSQLLSYYYTNKPTMYVLLQIFWWTCFCFSWVKHPGVKLPGHRISIGFTLKETAQQLSPSCCNILHSYYGGSSSCFTSSSALDMVGLLRFSLSSGCEMVAHRGFHLHFPND